jgi:DNA-binding response OmpR family regulator
MGLKKVKTIMARILIVDDDNTTREMIHTLLLRDGHDIVAVQRGHEAVEKAKDPAIKLVLLDMMMPDLSGLDVCRQIRTGATNADVPILIFSAMDRVENKLAAFKAGADDYLSKPVVVSEFRARITSLLSRERGKEAGAPAAPQASAAIDSSKNALNATIEAINIAKVRLAKGEITIEQFNELRQVITETDTLIEKATSASKNPQLAEASAKPGITKVE